MRVCAVFDIGKTNKKLFLFNENYEIVKEEQSQFEEILDDDGYACDDLINLKNWMQNSFENLINNSEFQVVGLNFSAYGASLVHLNRAGKALTPLYNYLKDFPKALYEDFLKKYDKNIFLETASPNLGMLNSGMQLYWLKYTKPEIFRQIAYSLHLPQYCSYLFTEQPHSEITSLGCHTALWDFNQNNYHKWVEEEHLHSINQVPTPSDSIYRLKNEVAVGVGLHDSSSALVPYLKTIDEKFVLLSTGTWSISLNPFNQEPLTSQELAWDTLCYMNFQGNPIKAARLFAGNEHQRQTKHLADYFNKDVNYFKDVQYDRDLVWILRSKYKQATPSSSDLGDLRECAFVERNLNLFKSYEEAYHQFMLDLVAQQVASLNLAIGRSDVKKIFVDGGFSKNEIYMNLLAETYFNKQVFAAEVAQASALGAAMVIHENWNTLPLNKEVISLKRYF